MILLDANLLLYAHHSAYAQHERARSWLAEQMATGMRIGIPWPTVLAFVRISTNPRAFSRPLPIATIWGVVRSWFSSSQIWTPQPMEGHAEILGNLLIGGNLGGKLVPDAHLAAIAIEHGLVLCSSDGDFARFAKLRWLNPIES